MTDEDFDEPLVIVRLLRLEVCSVEPWHWEGAEWACSSVTSDSER